MRIGFLHPWKTAAENQAFSSLRIAAERIGHELVHCTNSDEIERQAPAFVLASSSTQPKLTDVPHYGVIHEARDRFLANREYFQNLLSYDGYLTIADTLKKFLADVTCGVGESVPTGFYYNTCQRQEASADLAALIKRHELKITYFGTNWDQRRERFFRILSEAEGVEICGPANSWPLISRNAWGGSVAFDGSAVQQRYAKNGIGLCLLSSQHLRDDVISNRIFEISSVGALALCCDIPWIRKHFGDSVYYFDQSQPDQALRRAILKLRKVIYDNPAAAIDKAARARQIFESKFAAEIMVENAVQYHTMIACGRTKARCSAEQTYTPVISVIIRCGSRPIEYVERAVRSIANQTFGIFEVILVRHHDLDLTEIVDGVYPRIRSFRIVECSGGNRSRSLWCGLQSVEAEYFAVLDDDDWWFSDHFEKLFHPYPKSPQARFLAYSGSIIHQRFPREIMGGAEERRAIHAFGIKSRETWGSAASAFTSNCFVASSDLLHAELLKDPQMETAEDGYLLVALMAQAEPQFSYAATSAFDRSLADQSDFENHPARFEDELTLQLRTFGRNRPSFLSDDGWDSLAEHWTKRPKPVVPGDDPKSLKQDWDQVGGGYDPEKSRTARRSRLIDPVAGTAVIHPGATPWSYGAELSLNRPDRISPPYLLSVELIVRKGVVGVGLLNLKEDDFLVRQSLVAHSAPQTVDIPIPNFSLIGRLVIQNWDSHGESEVELLSLRMLAEPV